MSTTESWNVNRHTARWTSPVSAVYYYYCCCCCCCCCYYYYYYTVVVASNAICELLDQRAILERVLGNASKADKVVKERRRAHLAQLFEGIQNTHEEIMTELELLRKDDAKVDYA